MVLDDHFFRGVRLRHTWDRSALNGQKSYKIGSKSNRIWAKPLRDFLFFGTLRVDIKLRIFLILLIFQDVRLTAY